MTTVGCDRHRGHATFSDKTLTLIRASLRLDARSPSTTTTCRKPRFFPVFSSASCSDGQMVFAALAARCENPPCDLSFKSVAPETLPRAASSTQMSFEVTVPCHSGDGALGAARGLITGQVVRAGGHRSSKKFFSAAVVFKGIVPWCAYLPRRVPWPSEAHASRTRAARFSLRDRFAWSWHPIRLLSYPSIRT